ncbi:hypothetical protein CLU79DRAFT_780348 [Phycomyces nitens]|nr:hypothetical protein CLU79DRAFT_780348 [Phycomyces nitens]
MPDTLQGPYDQMEHLLKEQVDQLATTIPNILTDIKDHSAAQNELYEAREFMETAMMNLPGASTFLDRQAAVGRGSNTRLFNTSNLLQGSSETAIREAEKIAQKAYDCVRKASVECSQVSLIPITVLKKDEKVMAVLTTYRGYRLKIETLLRTRVNPRLNKLESELAINRFRYEQKSIEWVDRQVEMLGSVFWANGCLENIDLQQEISALRMGSSAAIAAIAAQTGGRVTVDDVLEVGLGEPEAHGQLPQYTPSTGDSQMTTLPAYTLDRAPDYQGSDQPPAYC